MAWTTSSRLFARATPIVLRVLADDPAMRAYFDRDRATFVNVLAVMGCGGDAALLGYVRHHLVADRELVTARHVYERTLLHDAAGAGRLALVAMLLGLGADPNAADRFGHSPLYAAGIRPGMVMSFTLSCAPGRTSMPRTP